MSAGYRVEAKTLPWQNYSEIEWKALGKGQVGKLFYIIAQHEISPDQADKWIPRWQLDLPLSELWQNKYSQVIRHIEDTHWLHTPPEDSLTITSAGNIFRRNPQLVDFLSATRRFVSTPEPTLDSYHPNGLSSLDIPILYKVPLESLHLTSDQAQKAYKDYQELAEVIWPEVRSCAARIRRKMLSDRVDIESQAGQVLMSYMMNYFWDTAYIDPEWTTHQFLTKIKDDIGKIAQHDAYQHPNQFITIRGGSWLQKTPDNISDTENQAIDNITSQRMIVEVTAEIDSILSQKREDKGLSSQRRVIALMYFVHGYTSMEIHKTTSIPYITVKNLVSKMTRSIKERRNLGETDSNRPRKQAYLNQVLSNIEKSKQAFERNKHLLSVSDKKLLAIFFDVYTDDKDTTIDAVHGHLPVTSRSSLRRRLDLALKVVNRERHLRSNSDGKPICTKGLNRITEARMVKVMFDENHQLLQGLPSYGLTVLRRYYLDGLETDDWSVNMEALGPEVGINPSSVSRFLAYFRVQMKKNLGNPKFAHSA